MDLSLKSRLVVLSFAHLVALGSLGAQPDSSTESDRPETSAPARVSSRSWPRYTLKMERAWQLNAPGGKPFEASGLLWTRDGQLLVLDDSGPGLYRIQFRKGWHSLDLELVPDLFTQSQLAPFQRLKVGLYDSEGVAEDAEGRLYVCEEASRWILRADPKTRTVDRLNIDWSPARKYFHPIDRNASFEGIAIGNGRLYVANERQRGRIIALDLESLKVVDDFAIQPRGSKARDVDYSDLSWFEDTLWVLLRESRCVLKVDPAKHQVLAEYDYRDVEADPEFVYYKKYPTGLMEGLAVDRDFIWLATDNNNLGRIRFPKDARPTLFKCPRPDRKPDPVKENAEAEQKSKQP